MSELDILYQDTVTLFNRVYVEEEQRYGYAPTGEMKSIWIPTVLNGVHMILDRGKIISTYGEQATDNVMLHVRYIGNRNKPVIQGKKYALPKAYRAMDPKSAGKHITFAYGDDFDFLMSGKWPELKNIKGNIDDDVYMNYGGFFNYMNREYDRVFAITGVAQYDLLPHFRITAR